MVAIPIVLLVFLALFTFFMLALIVVSIISYVKYCHYKGKKVEFAYENGKLKPIIVGEKAN